MWTAALPAVLLGYTGALLLGQDDQRLMVQKMADCSESAQERWMFDEEVV